MHCFTLRILWFLSSCRGLALDDLVLMHRNNTVPVTHLKIPVACQSNHRRTAPKRSCCPSVGSKAASVVSSFPGDECSPGPPGRFFSPCGLFQCYISFSSNHFSPESLEWFKLAYLFDLPWRWKSEYPSIAASDIFLRLLSASPVLSSLD